MTKFEEIKSKAKDFWLTHEQDIKDYAVAIGMGGVIGAVIGTVYNIGYGNGISTTIMACEAIAPEANVGSKFIQLGLKTKKK